MPEGPELYKAAKLVNDVCNGRVFHGKIVKSMVNKNPEVHHGFTDYTIQAESRGKEMALILSSVCPEGKKDNKGMEEKAKKLRVLFRFGMSGQFEFTAPSEIHKHAHLSFFTKGQSVMVLSFVDVRRFGRWEVNDSWSNNRGPDPILEYDAFRDNVLSNLDNKEFNKPLCEVMHNQKYFNGIGNYLRAEIIFRTGIPPFTLARDVFANLRIKKEFEETQILISTNPDILHLCSIVPREVLLLPGAGYGQSGDDSDYSAFMKWLQCYDNRNMTNLVDHDGRTMWFKGPAGPLAPKGGKSRSKRQQGKHSTQDKDVVVKEEKVKPKRKKAQRVQEKKKGTAKTVKKQAAVPTKVSSRKRKVLNSSKSLQVKEEVSKVPRMEKEETKTTSVRKVRKSSRCVKN